MSKKQKRQELMLTAQKARENLMAQVAEVWAKDVQDAAEKLSAAEKIEDVATRLSVLKSLDRELQQLSEKMTGQKDELAITLQKNSGFKDRRSFLDKLAMGSLITLAATGIPAATMSGGVITLPIVILFSLAGTSAVVGMTSAAFMSGNYDRKKKNNHLLGQQAEQFIEACKAPVLNLRGEAQKRISDIVQNDMAALIASPLFPQLAMEEDVKKAFNDMSMKKALDAVKMSAALPTSNSKELKL